MNNHRRIRLIDIAHKADVSYTAVAQVLRGSAGPRVKVGEATADRIRQIASELGYVPNQAARQLTGKPSGVIGVIGSHWFESLRSRLLLCLEHFADERGYVVMACYADGQSRHIEDRAKQYRARGVDGVLYVAHGNDAHWPVAAHCLAGLPVVVSLLGDPGIEHGHCVLTDHALAARRCVEHLHQRGRRRIVQVLEDLDAEANRKRWEGFVEAHRDLGRPVDDDQLCLARIGWKEADFPRYDELCEELVVRRKFDAILANDDICAMQILRAMRRRGLRAPDDVAVIGWGDDPGDYFDPAVTSVRFRLDNIARSAVAIVAEAVEKSGEMKLARETIRPELIVRESS